MSKADAVMLAVVLIRFVIPLFIPKFPLPAIVACLVVDAADQTIFQMVTDDPLPGYQSYDKALDVYYLAIAYVSTMRNWRVRDAAQVARFLYLYRLVGVTLFELFDERWLLLVFPNTFEYFFIAYEGIRTRWNPARLSHRAVIGLAAFIWIFIKLPQEWWIHIAQLDFTDFMADYPFLWYVLFGAAAIAAAVIWHYRRLIPGADWAFTVDVDRHLEPAVGGARAQERFWSAVLAEKAFFLMLLCVIFANVLPDVRASNLGVAIGVAAIVVLNAAISQAWRRRGRSWATAGGQFAAMLLVNVGIVTLDSLFGERGDSDAPATNTLFFVLLLSLMIALFDRYHSIQERAAPRAVA